MSDAFGTLTTIETDQGRRTIHSLPALEKGGNGSIGRLPYSMRILLEAALRNLDSFQVTERDVQRIAAWDPTKIPDEEIAFKPGRVVLQDFTGVPAVVDLAALRSAMVRMGGNPEKINPRIQVDLVVDHSVMVDHFASSDALEKNLALEFKRNRERYEFLKWGQKAFRNFGIVPPGAGIIHQVNLEYLAKLVLESGQMLYPDSLVGTDSHTTMINGVGVVGWGVGGIEAEACMLGQPLSMLLPQVVGFRLKGKLPPGATATDLVLRVTELLREMRVVGKFVEFFGPGLSSLTLPDRATIANMAPEYGATMGYFPVDATTLGYLRDTGRDPALIKLVEHYYKEQNLWFSSDVEPEYSEIVELDLSTIVPALAGPKRPQDRIALTAMKNEWQRSLAAPVSERGFAVTGPAATGETIVPGMQERDGSPVKLRHGSLVLAAITSCTNTSNPGVMVAAGLVARKAAARGVTRKPWVKTSLAPGSRVVTDYLTASGLLDDLEKLGFHIVGYGCTTCIGNSGPLPETVAKAIHDGDLVAAAVLSGNRNFEGRINPDIRANYLASPPLVVAYALAGRIDIDFENEPITTDAAGKPLYLREIWPTTEEIAATVTSSLQPQMYRDRYERVLEDNKLWNQIESSEGSVYDWQADSTYIQEPPFFIDMPREPQPIRPITGARALAKLGDSVTTDHISPAGSIPDSSPAGQWLQSQGVNVPDFNSYGSRRGNDRVMTRGTFGNIRLRNLLAPGTEGGFSRHITSGDVGSLYEVAERYRSESTPLIVLAGSEYGTGSSRDWAAKGTYLLGVRAVLAVSYERIHRSNLVGMGVLPLQYMPGENAETLGLTGEELFSLPNLSDDIRPMQELTLKADDRSIQVIARLDTPVEIGYYRNGGILHTVLRNFLR